MKNSHAASAVPSNLHEAILRDGYAFVRAATTQQLLAQAGPLSDWQDFTDSWDDLRPDTYLAEHGRHRLRRHAVYATVRDGAIERQPHRPHYQTLDYNPLHGGIERWFEPVAPEIGDGPSMRAILTFCRALFGSLAPTRRAWHIEVHQFRIEARAGEWGHPTPEGMHRDGVDYVLVLLIQRRNIASGTTLIESMDKKVSGSFTLTDPFDTALVEDARVYHGVTPVEPLDPSTPAYRDVLVVTFRSA